MLFGGVNLKKTVPATSYGQEKEATVNRAQLIKYKGWTHVLMKEIFLCVYE